MKYVPLTLLLTACTADPTVEDVRSVPGAHPIAAAVDAPYDLTLRAPTPYPGRPWTVRISGATPGATVALAGTVNGGGPGRCPPAWGGTCLDLKGRKVRLMGSTTADGHGVATFRTRVPRVLPNGVRFSFQAVELAGRATRTSNVFGVVGGDVDGDGVLDRVDPCVGLADVCPCTPPPNGEIFIFPMGRGTADQGGRSGLSAWARATIPPIDLGYGHGPRTYTATALASLVGDSLADLPENHCFWPDGNVLGLTADGYPSILADGWDDFVHGRLHTPLGEAVGLDEAESFWTGTSVDGEATGFDCGGWTSAWRADASVSPAEDPREDWAEDPGVIAACGVERPWLGVAWCVMGDCSLP